MLNFLIIDTNFAVNRYCLWSYSVILCFLKKAFVISLFCCNMWHFLICWESDGLCRFINRRIYKLTEDHPSVPVSQTKNDHTVLLCYDESKLELFYMKWLIVDKTEARLMSLRNVCGCTYFFTTTNNRLHQPRGLELIWTQKQWHYSLENGITIQLQETFRIKIWGHLFWRIILQKHKKPFSSYVILSWVLPCHFHVWNSFCRQFWLEKVI